MLTDLCTKCGRCCNGSVFKLTTLNREEQQRFKRADLPQPCPYFKGTCVIYDERPEACQNFQCNAARELLAGTMTLEQALQSTAQSIVL